MNSSMPQAPSPKPPLPPGSTIGILGGGQLGRMLAMAAAQMGYHAHIYCPEADAPALEVARAHTLGSYTDEAKLQAFARAVDVVTLEFENVPCEALRIMEPHVTLHPGEAALGVCQHRVREKQFVHLHGIGTAPFAAVTSEAELEQAVREIGTPAILKTARMGYDGKGQAKIHSPGEALAAWKSIGRQEAILEGFVDFTMEISVVIARSANGEMASYCPVQNIHRHHILHQTIAPAPIAPEQAREAGRMARALAEGLGLVGILAIEMFVCRDGTLLVNELAPRPHNSGHWTMDACPTSQFALAVRAVCGLPLVGTERNCDAVMTNLIGHEADAWQEWLKKPGAVLHLYGKKEAREGRKMGHVTELVTKI